MNTRNITPKLSCIIPIYNVESYLQQCLDTISMQTFRDFECICVDDGSTDESASIANQFCAKDPRFKLVQQSNRGLAGARNTGLKHSTGDFICFVDSDDFIHPEAFGYLLELALVNKADLVCFDYKEIPEYVSPDNITFVSVLDDPIVVTTTPLLSFADKAISVKPNAWSKLYSSSLLQNMYFDEGMKIHEDTFFSIEILNLAHKMVCSNAALYFYRIRPGSIMTSKNYELSLTNLALAATLTAKLINKTDLTQKQKSNILLEGGLLTFAMISVDLVLNKSLPNHEKKRLMVHCNNLIRDLKLKNILQYNKLSIFLRSGMFLCYEINTPFLFYRIHKLYMNIMSFLRRTL